MDDPLINRIQDCLDPHQVLVTPEDLKNHPGLFENVDPTPWWIVKDIEGNYDFGTLNALGRTSKHFTLLRKVFLAEWRIFDPKSPSGQTITAEEYLSNPSLYVILDMAAKVIRTDIHMAVIEHVPMETYKALPDMYDLIEVVYAVRQRTPEEFDESEIPHTG